MGQDIHTEGQHAAILLGPAAPNRPTQFVNDQLFESGDDMIGLRVLVFSITIVILVGANRFSVEAQVPPATGQSASWESESPRLALNLALLQEHIPAGHTPVALLTVRNPSKTDMPFPKDRVHVEGENGESPTTLLQRQLTHRLRRGEKEIRSGGFEPLILAGASSTRKYDLERFYDLSEPGKYTVYIEVLDAAASKDNAGVWLRSNTVSFEIEAPSQ
jgi:hypothetical protein